MREPAGLDVHSAKYPNSLGFQQKIRKLFFIEKAGSILYYRIVPAYHFVGIVYKFRVIRSITMTVLESEPMSRHTTFRTGGPARWFCPVSCVSEMIEVMDFAAEKNLPLYVIGRGSNLLVSDRGIDGVVMEIADGFKKITVTQNTESEECGYIYAEAGAQLSAVAAAARDAGLAGLAFASGIPGTIGGGISMNAGAYGGEMKDCVEYVDVLHMESGTGHEPGDPGEETEGVSYRRERISGKDMRFSYRHSRCQEEKILILGAMLKLPKGDSEKIAEEMKDLNQRRREKQPLEYPSAGSTFKRPEGHFAGKLIQDAGLRGCAVGDAMVSEKHCGFVINRGNATSDDIYRLIRHIEEEVEKQFGVRLETEVRLLGDFSMS